MAGDSLCAGGPKSLKEGETWPGGKRKLRNCRGRSWNIGGGIYDLSGKDYSQRSSSTQSFRTFDRQAVMHRNKHSGTVLRNASATSLPHLVLG